MTNPLNWKKHEEYDIWKDDRSSAKVMREQMTYMLTPEEMAKRDEHILQDTPVAPLEQRSHTVRLGPTAQTDITINSYTDTSKPETDPHILANNLANLQANPAGFNQYKQSNQLEKERFRTNKLLEQTINSVGAGDHAEGLATTERYKTLNPTPSKAPVRTDETFTEARANAQDITWPKSGMTAAEQAASAVATRNQQRGFEYEQGMGKMLQKGRWDIIPEVEKAESDFTYELGKEAGAKVADAYKENWEPVIHSIDGSETSFQKHFKDNPEYYQKLLPNILKSAANTIHDTDTASVEGFKEDGENFWKGAENTLDRIENLTYKTAFGINELFSEQNEKLSIRNVLAQEIYDSNKRVAEGKAQLVSLDEIIDPADPEKSVNNLRAYFYQSGLGQHVFDIAVLRATKGAGLAGKYAINILDATIDLWVNDIIENGRDDFLSALGDGIMAGKPTTSDVLIDVVSSQLGPLAGTAIQFLWSVFTEDEREVLMQEVKSRQASRRNMKSK